MPTILKVGYTGARQNLHQSSGSTGMARLHSQQNGSEAYLTLKTYFQGHRTSFQGLETKSKEVQRSFKGLTRTWTVCKWLAAQIVTNNRRHTYNEMRMKQHIQSSAASSVSPTRTACKVELPNKAQHGMSISLLCQYSPPCFDCQSRLERHTRKLPGSSISHK